MLKHMPCLTVGYTWESRPGLWRFRLLQSVTVESQDLAQKRGIGIWSSSARRRLRFLSFEERKRKRAGKQGGGEEGRTGAGEAKERRASAGVGAVGERAS